MFTWLVAAFSVALVIAGDKFIKDIALSGEGYFSKESFVAMALYAAGVPCWIYVMQQKTLPQVAVMYAVLSIVGVTLLGVFYKEYPSGWQIAALVCAMAAAVMVEL